ncbi:MAG: glycosyltransferase family 39 protein [Chloroflexota bacterium]
MFSVLACTLLGFVLRAHTLPDANVWSDEAFTAWLSRYDIFGIMLRTAGDTHPPLSYILYHFWQPVAGRSAYALRFMSVMFGVAAVPAVAATGRRVGGPWAGGIAAFLLAVSRFDIWWSQQIRMYAMSTMLCAISLALFVMGMSHWKRDRRRAARLLVLMGVVNLANLYTLYFSVVLIVLESVYVLCAILRQRDGRLFGTWTSIHLVSIALFLPWLNFFHQHAIRFAPQPGHLTIAQFVESSWSELAVGIDTHVSRSRPVNLALGGLAILLLTALLARPPSKRRPAILWLALVVVFFPAVAYVATLQTGLFYSPSYQTRYEILSTPALVVLLGWAIAALPGPARLVPAAVFAGVAIYTLPLLYHRRHLVDDYQSIARFVQAYERPGDTIVIDPDWKFDLFLFPYQGHLRWQGLPLNQHLSAAEVNQRFSKWAAQYRGIWLVQVAGGQDAGPDHFVRGWLNTHMQRSSEMVVNDELARLYLPKGSPPRTLAPNFRPEKPLAGVKGIRGFDQPIHDLRTGDVLHLAFYGTPNPAIELRLGSQVFRGRALPGQLQFAIPVSPAAPNGHHRLWLLLPGGTKRAVSSVYIEPHPAAVPAPPVPPLARKVGQDFGGLALLTSYQISPNPVQPGQTLAVDLQWRAEQPFSQDYYVFVHLLNGQNKVVAQRDSQPQNGRLPTVQWLAGQTINDPYQLSLPAKLPAGRYSIEVGMYLQSTGQRLKLQGPAAADHLVLQEVTIR